MKEKELDYLDPFGEILVSVAWAVRASYNSATDATPTQLVLDRDMLFNLNTLVNWKELSIRKQKLVDKANLRENKNRIDCLPGKTTSIHQDWWNIKKNG